MKWAGDRSLHVGRWLGLLFIPESEREVSELLLAQLDEHAPVLPPVLAHVAGLRPQVVLDVDVAPDL